MQQLTVSELAQKPGFRRTAAWKRVVTKLLQSCYPRVTPRVHNGYHRARCSSLPFPAITPGAPGFRLQVKAGQGHGLLSHIPRWRCKIHAYGRG